MRHRIKGRTLGRNASHRRAMFRNMAASMIRTLGEFDDNDILRPKVPGRIITTVAKAKELRPFIERLITLAVKAKPHQQAADKLKTSASRGSSEFKAWRESADWRKWNQAIAPAVALRRRAFAMLRDKDAVRILFNVLADRFENRNGGYTRIARISTVRLGDGGQQALIEFCGTNDRKKSRKGRGGSMPVAAKSDASGAAS